MKELLGDALSDLQAQGLLRSLRPMPATGGRFVYHGRDFLNFSSNDYLNLSNDSRLKQASSDAIEKWGCGATASRLMCGHLELHAEVEEKLARLTGQESALIFGSGFLTNLGILTALADRKDIIFSDKLNHASLIDGARLSRAKIIRYKHKDVEHLQLLLDENPAPDSSRRIIVTDSVFSMDGDIAPLSELDALAQKYNAWLVVDEAHAIGVMGERGGGVCCLPEVNVQPTITVGTFSKALGGYGGFVACSSEMRKLLINRARSFIYSTGLPPACLSSTGRALEILEEEADIGLRLLEKSRVLHQALIHNGISMPVFESQILPVVIGPNQETLELAQTLEEQGILATAVRPPTVPEATARLRLTVTLAHGEEDLQRLASIIGAEVNRVKASR